MSDSEHLIQKEIKRGSNSQKKQMALKSLNNYIEQLKIHYDLNENDIIRILKIILRIKNRDNFIKKIWHIFK